MANKSEVCTQVMSVIVGGRPRLLPDAHVYPYLSITDQLRLITSRHGVEDAMVDWCGRLPAAAREAGGQEWMGDIVDGSVWAEFQTMPDSQEPLLMPYGNGLGLLYNTDGFQPADDRQYCVTANYLVILNLPRHLRYRKENMVLVGLIPDGSHSNAEQGRAYATFTDPMVDELLTLWADPDDDGSGNRLGRRALLVVVACDSPAARDVGGFSGTGSRTEGPRRVADWPAQAGSASGQPDFGRAGTNGTFKECDAFPLRTRTDWVDAGLAWLDSTTKGGREAVRKKTGCRHSPLMRLPYLRPDMFAVDPMHCFYEGVWKDYLAVVLSDELSKTSSALLRQWEGEVARWSFPRNVGPITGKLKSKLAGLKAAELKNLLGICMFVLVDGDGEEAGGVRLTPPTGDASMEDAPPFEQSDEYQLLCLLVEMAEVIGLGYVGSAQIDRLEEIAVFYCDLYETTFGSAALKPNHRQLLELAACMRQYGPCPGFWLFALERWNGQVQRGTHQFADIECSIMRNHVHRARLRSLAAREVEQPDPDGESEDQRTVVSTLLGRCDGVSAGTWPGWRAPLEDDLLARLDPVTLSATPVSELIVQYVARLDVPGPYWSAIRGDEWFPGSVRGPAPAWFVPDVEQLKRCVAAIFRTLAMPCVALDVDVSDPVCHSVLTLCGAKFQASNPVLGRLVHASCVCVAHSATADQAPPERGRFDAAPPPNEAVVHPGLIEGFVTTTARVHGRSFALTLARVHWFAEAEPRGGSHIQRYRARQFTSVARAAAHSDYAYIPVQRIESSFVPLSHRVHREMFSIGPLPWPFLF
jgi:hypothetical protein